MRLALGLVALASAFGGGLFVGWRAGSASAAKQEAASAKAQLAHVTGSVQQQIVERTATLHRQLTESLELRHETVRIDLRFQHLDRQIEKAAFGEADSSCVHGPVDTTEFVRLYDAAARGGRSAAVAPAASARRMHAQGIGTTPTFFAPPANQLSGLGPKASGAHIADAEGAGCQAISCAARSGSSMRARDGTN